MADQPDSAAATAVVFRPRKLRIVGVVFSLGLCCLSALGWLVLPANQRALFTWSQLLTLLIFLGVIVAILLAMATSYVRADARGVRLRNGLLSQQVEWDRVHKILLRPGDPWGLMLLKPADGSPFEVDLDAEKRHLFAIQANDGERAQDVIRDLQRRQRVAQGG
jgi:hypothetical protein